MTKPKNTTVTYLGPFDAVDGEGFHFAKGEPQEVPTPLAESLLLQDSFSLPDSPAPEEQ